MFQEWYVSLQISKSSWMDNHVSEHCVLGRLSKSISPLFIFIALLSIARLSELASDDFDLIGVLSNVAIIVAGGAFLSLKMSWEQQAAFILISFKVVLGFLSLIFIYFSVTDFIKGEWGAMPYFLVGVTFLPVWEFMFGLYKHHGKLTAFRVVSLIIAGISIYIQIET
jgi:hypothetical protein